MTKNRLIIIGLVLAVGVLTALWLLLPLNSSTSATPASFIPAAQVKQEQPQTTDQSGLPQPIFKEKVSEEILQQKTTGGKQTQLEQEKAFLRAFSTPINFWGKVVDEEGNPVSGAIIKLGTANRPWQTGTQYERITDTAGLFEVSGVKGLSISVNVSKEGYYQTPRSRGQLSYAQPSGNKYPLPTSDKPAIFELRKMGETVPLIHVSERSVRLPKNGSPVEVNLETGLTTGSGDLKVQCWTNDQDKDAQGRYDWKCVLTVSGGGLIERTDRFAFEAPAEGYKESVELMSPLVRWVSNVEKQYFVKLSDNRYARINFRMRTGGEHFFVVEAYLNPTPGSRNLEYDPSKRIDL